jgi:hypothetical protein
MPLHKRSLNPRRARGGGLSPDKNRFGHRAVMVAAVSGKRGKRYLKRQQLLSNEPG